jgi:hypothetical protein
MRQANRDHTGFATRISSLIRDPVVRAAFQRAERDYGQTFAVPDDPPHALDGGAAEPVSALEVAA